MEENGPVSTIKELFSVPSVSRAKSIELSICDAVHFRLQAPLSIFQMAELKLLERKRESFIGFAEARNEMEQTMRGASVREKVEACCTRHPEWLNERQILYSTELEVWMDMSYPNPWSLQVYQAALMERKAVSIPKLGPFSETFHTLLKEKNGYELTGPSLPGPQTVRVHIGEQTFLQDPYLHLVTHRRESRPHPFADNAELGSQLAFGLLEKHLEDVSAKETDDDTSRIRLFGYRLIGPMLLLLIQEVATKSGLVAFTGEGSGFLSTLFDSLRSVWPWLPKLVDPSQTEQLYSIFPENNIRMSLLPTRSHGQLSSLLSFDESMPLEVLLPAARLFMLAAFTGRESAAMQHAAGNFIRDYAGLTRGLKVRLPVEPVIRYWCRRILSPKQDFVEWVRRKPIFPNYKAGPGIMKLRSQLLKGPWPTGTYYGARSFGRWWLRLRAGAQVRRIETALLDYK